MSYISILDFAKIVEELTREDFETANNFLKIIEEVCSFLIIRQS